MKTLLDVQNEIRDVGQLLSDTARRLDTLSAEVRDLRTSDAGRDTNRYQTIREMAKSVPLRSHPLAGTEDTGGSLRRLYLTLLTSAVRLCGEDLTLPLSYVQWVLAFSGLDMTLEDLYTESLKPESVDYDAVRESIRDDLRLCLIVDMLTAVQMNEEDSAPEALEYVSSLCAVMGLSEEDVKACSAAVRVILCGYENVDKEEAFDAMMFPSLKHYLGYEGVHALATKCRTIVCKVSKSDYWSNNTYLWTRPEQGSYVQKNETMLRIERLRYVSVFDLWTGQQADTRKYIYEAPCDGWLYHWEQDGVHYGVISCKNDNIDSIKDWVKKEDKHE